MILSELGSTGRPETSSFQGLSGGNTCSAARIASASGVSNITGALISGKGGRLRSPGRCDPRQGRPLASAGGLSPGLQEQAGREQEHRERQQTSGPHDCPSYRVGPFSPAPWFMALFHPASMKPTISPVTATSSGDFFV